MGGLKWNKTCFTIYNMEWDPKTTCDNCIDINFLICQKEACPTTKRLHWQGYYECKKRLGKAGHQKNLGAPGCHIEMCNGTPEENIIYCTKSESKIDGTEFRYGNPAKQGQGARNDLIDLKNDLDKGKKLKDIADDHFEEFLRYNRGIKEYMLLKTKKRTWKTELHIIVGPAGCGKTKHVYDTYNIDDICNIDATQTGVWWDNYDNEDIVIIDEYHGQIPFTTLLKLTDRYPFTVPKKGSICQFTSKKIYIISNKLPEEWYPEVSKDERLWAAFLRRIDNYINYYNEGTAKDLGRTPCSINSNNNDLDYLPL